MTRKRLKPHKQRGMMRRRRNDKRKRRKVEIKLIPREEEPEQKIAEKTE